MCDIAKLAELVHKVLPSLFTLQVGGGEGDEEFEERFLNCFGLGDPNAASAKNAVSRTASQPNAEEREELLKEQKKNSPWYESGVIEGRN